MKCARLIAASALALAAAGCQAGSSHDQGAIYPSKDPVVTDVVRGNTAFATDLYGRLRQRPGNLFFSPVSISTALAMAFAGARGATLAEMQRTLRWPVNPPKVHEAFGHLVAGWAAPEGGPDTPLLFAANRIWCQAGLSLSPAFLSVTKDVYGAAAAEVDFKKSPEPTRQEINAWVSEQTHDRIKDLIKPGVVDDATRLVLTSAIYFKGAWESPFPAEQTKTEPFFTTPSQSRPVPMMHQGELKANYAEVSRATVLDIPYRSSDARRSLSLLVALPDKKDGLSDLESRLSEEEIASWVSDLEPAEVIASLPRFKFTADFDLAGTLAAMGMGRAFSDRADFSGITTAIPIKISAVVHQAFVDVNEEGTEAAAATAVAMAEVLLIRKSPPHRVFRADHPFLVILRDRATGTILFMGRVVDPVA